MLSRDAAFEVAARPLQERVDLVMAGVAAVGAMSDEIVPELPHMRSRPVRYGGEFGGFNERASHMAEIAESSLADIAVGEDETFRRYIKRVPYGVVRRWRGTFTGVGTKLGGQDPGYVIEDAAVDILINGVMFNSGQCCCGIERIYGHENLFDDFVAKAVDIVKSYKLGNPLASGTTLGSIASIRFVGEVRAQIAVADGAEAHIETFPEDDGGAYLTPQTLTNVTHDMRLMRDESFGPVVGIMKVSSDEEAIALMNDSEFGLTASLWTRDVDRAARVGYQIETGTVFMNRADYLDPGLCWTGCKNTGRGVACRSLGITI